MTLNFNYKLGDLNVYIYISIIAGVSYIIQNICDYYALFTTTKINTCHNRFKEFEEKYPSILKNPLAIRKEYLDCTHVIKGHIGKLPFKELKKYYEEELLI